MTLEEAQNTMKISDEERNAVETYLGFRHTDVNMLVDFDIILLDKLQKKGWNIDQTGEYLGSNIDIFLKMYSVMYKNSKQNNSSRNKLIRGTSRDEVNKLMRANKNCKRILSTSRKEEIARTFCEYDNAALIWVSTEEGTPYLDVNSFIGEENLNRNEEEVIISPFAKVKKLESNGKYQSYEYYSMRLGPPELEQIPEDELEELRKRIYDNYAQNVKDGKEYLWLKDKKDLNEIRLKNTKDKEDREFLQDEIAASEAKSAELLSRCSEMKTAISRYIMGLCKQKELEIDKAYEVIEENKKRIAEEKENALKEETRKSLISKNLNNKKNGEQECEKLSESLEQEYNQLKQTEQSYINMAKRLGIPYTKTIGNSNIEDNLKKAKENIVQIREKLSKIEVSEEDKKEESESKDKEIKLLTDRVEFAEELAKDFDEINNVYKDECSVDIKRGVDHKVQMLVRDAKIADLMKEKEELQGKKTSIFERLSGREKLNQAKLENIDLQLKLLKEQKPMEKSHYSIRESMVELGVQLFKEGIHTNEMHNMYNAIGREISQTDREYIMRLTSQKLETRLVPVEKKQRLFGGNKRELDRILNDNVNLRNQITQVVSNNRNPDGFYAQDVRKCNKPV